MTLRQLLFSCLLLPTYFSLDALAAENGKDADLKILASRLYVNCLSEEGERILSKSPKTKPNSFERTGATSCKKQETQLREVLQLDMLELQIKQKKILNTETQRVIAETIEQVIVNMRRSIVILYAEAFDERNPGLRACAVTAGKAKDNKLQYICAVQD